MLMEYHLSLFDSKLLILGKSFKFEQNFLILIMTITKILEVKQFSQKIYFIRIVALCTSYLSCYAYCISRIQLK